MESTELIEKFLIMEEKNNFFDLKIDKIKFWMYIRFDVYTTLMENYRLFNKNISYDAKFDIKPDLSERIKRMTIKNQFFLHTKEILIFSSSRKIKEKEYYKCVYTDIISKNLDNTYYIFDSDYDGVFYYPRSVSGIKNLDINTYKLFCKKRDRVSFHGSMLENSIYNIIEQNFDKPLTIKQKIKINSLLVDFLNKRSYLKNYYYYILRRTKPKVIIIVCYYSFEMMILCEVAKELNIPVIELQHGTMGREHISYNFLRKRKIKSFPDYIFTFSQYDKKVSRVPISFDRISAVGYPEMENKIKIYKQAFLKEKKKKKILFISQTLREIFEYAAELSKRLDLDKFEIIIKLHPREFGNWRKEFGKILKDCSVTIIDNSNKDIYYYLAQADYVVGIFSTVLLEATMFNTNIVILKKASYTYMKELYENNMAQLIDNIDMLEEIVTNNLCTSVKTKTYFESNSIIKVKEAIKNIIEKGKIR